MTTSNNSTKIGVVSDTHLPDFGSLPLVMLNEFQDVDLIIHLGDFCSISAYKDLQKIAPVLAVHGNMDDPELKSLLPEKKTIEVQGYNLGLIHGWGPPKNLEKRVRESFSDVDIILFGHSHVPLFTKINDVVLFNPGSPSMNRDGSSTFGILDLSDTINHQIIRVDT